MSINESMTLLADAIREKSGASGKLSIAAMTEAVNGITLNTGGDIDFTGVNVTANDLLSGVVAVNASGVKVTGNIETVTATLDGDTVTVPAGFIAQQQTFTVTPKLPETNFTALDLKPGATALDGTGTLIDGAMPQATLTPELSFSEEYGSYYFYCKVTESGYVEKGSSVGEVRQSVPKAHIQGVSRHHELDDILDKYTYLVNMTTGYVVEADYRPFYLDKLSYTVSGLTVELGYECMCMGETITVELPQVSFTAEDLKPGVTAINTAGEVVEGNMPYAGVSENDRQIIIQSGYVPETLTFNKGGGSFVKVMNFIEPHDAYTTVTAINVTGWGLLYNEDYGEEEDFSKYNGVYAVTPATANEQELTDRVFKHPTEKMYIFFGQETENGEGDCWFFASSTDDTSAYGALAYKNGKELPNGQFTWYKTYSDSPVLTTTHVISDVPAQPLVLSGETATLENGAWTIGSAVTLSGYDKTPLKHGIYMVSDNKLIGDAIAYHANMYMPTDGLLMYFPMDDSGDVAVDVVSGIRLIRSSKALTPTADGWVNAAYKAQLIGANTSFAFPETFTLAARVRVDASDVVDVVAPIISFGEWNYEYYQESFGLIVDTSRGDIGYRYGSSHSPYHGGQVIAGDLKGNGKITLGQEYQVTVTYDGTHLRMYSSGEQTRVNYSSQDEITIPKTTPTVLMFADTERNGFVGKIDEVMLWDRVLSDDEIATLI